MPRLGTGAMEAQVLGWVRCSGAWVGDGQNGVSEDNNMREGPTCRQLGPDKTDECSGLPRITDIT